MNGDEKMVIEVNKSIFDSLTETEKTVVKYINSNESNIPNMSIVDVAEKSLLLQQRFLELLKNVD